MKYLKIAEGVSELFPKKVKVQLVHFITGKKIGSFNFLPSSIPEKFNGPTTIEVESNCWRIVDVAYLREASLFSGRKLILRVSEAGAEGIDWGYDIPTTAHSFPVLDHCYDLSRTSINLSSGNWRQIEFLPLDLLPEIQEDVSEIKTLLTPEDEWQNLKGYQRIHIRKQEFDNVLKIPMKGLLNLLTPINDISEIRINGQLLPNGFSFQTYSHQYYGISMDGLICQLGIGNMESVDEEIMLVASSFQLVLADWCNASIFLNSEGEMPEQEVIPF